MKNVIVLVKSMFHDESFNLSFFLAMYTQQKSSTKVFFIIFLFQQDFHFRFDKASNLIMNERFI